MNITGYPPYVCVLVGLVFIKYSTLYYWIAENRVGQTFLFAGHIFFLNVRAEAKSRAPVFNQLHVIRSEFPNKQNTRRILAPDNCSVITLIAGHD